MSYINLYTGYGRKVCSKPRGSAYQEKFTIDSDPLLIHEVMLVINMDSYQFWGLRLSPTRCKPIVTLIFHLTGTLCKVTSDATATHILLQPRHSLKFIRTLCSWLLSWKQWEKWSFIFISLSWIRHQFSIIPVFSKYTDCQKSTLKLDYCHCHIVYIFISYHRFFECFILFLENCRTNNCITDGFSYFSRIKFYWRISTC